MHLSPFVVVANRLPIQHGESGWSPSPGGLVSALSPVLAERSAAWVGWSGDESEEQPPLFDTKTMFVPIGLSPEEVEGFYDGLSNRAIWPLFHDAIRPPEFNWDWWDAYQTVNARFAERAAGVAAPGACVWVHDYQLLLVPEILRGLRPDLRIGFFLHIPFPPQELFMQLPWRRRLVEGMLGADVVGFQVPDAARNFLRLATRLTAARRRGAALSLGDRVLHVGAYPISIDVEHFEQLAAGSEVQRRAAELREQLGNPGQILLGVDRLDYTKGIEARLTAFKEMLHDGAIEVPDVVMVQIAVPTRDNVPAYNEVRAEVEQLVGELNGDFGAVGSPAVHYLHQSLEPEDLVALYCAADVLVVTPFRDGMNLVVKEFIASRVRGTGSVVLSEFAGAARDLPNAILVNPYDRVAVKQGILDALTMTSAGERRRMRALRRSVTSWKVSDWAAAFLADLGECPEETPPGPESEEIGAPQRMAS